MDERIRIPNLPDGKVTSAIIGEGHGDIAQALTRLGVRLYYCAENALIDKCARNHADMAAYYLGNNKILVEKRQLRLASQLTRDGFEVILSSRAAEGAYPNDVPLNCFAVSETLVGRLESAEPLLVESYSRHLSIRQGYAKCSALIVNDRAVITDDVTVKNACDKLHVDCLLIEKGDIELDGGRCGFIGGASCKLDRDTVAFFGELGTHASRDIIIEFLNKNNTGFVELIKGRLRDIGGIVALTGQGCSRPKGNYGYLSS